MRKSRSLRICLHCGAGNLVTATDCYFCHEQDLLRLDEPPPKPRRLTIGSLMRFTVFVALYFAFWRAVPELAILLAFLVIPALIRTIFGVRRAKNRGQETNLRMYLFRMIVSLSTVIIALAVGVFASGVCMVVLSQRFTSNPGDVMLVLTFAWGVGLIVFGLVMAGLWRI